MKYGTKKYEITLGEYKLLIENIDYLDQSKKDWEEIKELKCMEGLEKKFEKISAKISDPMNRISEFRIDDWRKEELEQKLRESEQRQNQEEPSTNIFGGAPRVRSPIYGGSVSRSPIYGG